ncbi:ATP-binding protein [Ihubacter sp. mB4P-1]|uniref:ATP-binding protein n=1 Tax=Ihubacter sp. mB4P-1 TaxID=3242370 RepID=UPI003C7AB677
MREHRSLELKESVTNTFLKTVSAYANYDGGVIIFGVSDDGTIKGIEDPEKVCLDIENKINDSIVPQPDYTLCIKDDERTVHLTVKSGTSKSYLYKSKAYKRNDSSTIEVDSVEFTRLVLSGRHMNYEELASAEQALSFTVLSEMMQEINGIADFDQDILKTLNLYSDQNGYNIAAAILADQNNFPGIDIAKFGETISIIEKRATFDHMSILSAYKNAMSLFRDYYQYEIIDGAVRKTVERIPEAAFRETIANAFIHRLWDVNVQTRVSMFNDRIEVVSPGGLPAGLTEAEYLSGRISVLRNPIIANVFYRLKIVEIFGTGILRIHQTYQHSVMKPSFEFGENTIKVILPVIEMQPDMTADEREIYRLLSPTRQKSISEIASAASFGKTKVTNLLKEMAARGVVKIEGKGRGTKYRL